MSELVIAAVQQQWDIVDDNLDDVVDKVLNNENENRDQIPDPRGLIKRQGFFFSWNYSVSI